MPSMASGTIRSFRELARLRALFFDDSLVSLSRQDRLAILEKKTADPQHVPSPEIFVDRVPVPPSLLKDWTDQGVHYVGGRINEQLRQQWKHWGQGHVATSF